MDEKLEYLGLIWKLTSFLIVTLLRETQSRIESDKR